MRTDIPASVAAELDARTRNLALFVRVATADPVQVWSGPRGRVVTAGGYDWTAIGGLLRVTGLGASLGGRVGRFTVAAHGLASSGTLGAALDAADIRDVAAEVSIGCCDDAWRLIGGLVAVASGRGDVMRYEIDEVVTVVLECEDKTARLRRAAGIVASPERQKAQHPGDTFFDLLDLPTVLGRR